MAADHCSSPWLYGLSDLFDPLILFGLFSPDQSAACLQAAGDCGSWLSIPYCLSFLFLVAFIVLIYASLNAFAKTMPSVPQDLGRLLHWQLQKLASRAPSNR